MSFMKKIAALLAALSLLVPYTAFAAADNYIEETFTVDLTGRYIKSPKRAVMPFGLLSFNDGKDVMTPQQKQFVEYLADQIVKTHEHTIHIPSEKSIHSSEFTRDMAYSIAIYMQQDRPDIFYIAEEIGMSYMASGSTGLVLSVTLNDGAYTMTNEEIEAAQRVIDAEVEKISGLAEKCANDLEKVLFVHDYIVSNYEYDTRVTSNDEDIAGQANRTLYTMIRDKKGVCQGYTYLFMAVMQKLHIDCITVPTDELAHIWNKVKIDNVWYNIDLTYDDQLPDRSVNISHAYFLVNDNEIKNLDPSDEEVYLYLIDEEGYWNYLPDAELFLSDDEQYYIVTNGTETLVEHGDVAMDDSGYVVITENGVPKIGYILAEKSCHCTWNEYNWDGKEAIRSDSTAFSGSVIHHIKGTTAYSDGTFYCLNAQNDVCRVDYTGNILAVDGIVTSGFRWHDENRRFYKTRDGSPYYSSTLSMINDKIYVNSDDKVYRYAPGVNNEFGQAAEVYSYTAGQGDSFRAIYGLVSKDGKLYAELALDPAANYTLFEIPLEEEFIIPSYTVPPCGDAVYEDTSSGEVKVTVNVPVEVIKDFKNTEPDVLIAQYDDNGALISISAAQTGSVFTQSAEGDGNNTDSYEYTAVITPADNAAALTTFVWAKEFLIPLSAPVPHAIDRGPDIHPVEPQAYEGN